MAEVQETSEATDAVNTSNGAEAAAEGTEVATGVGATDAPADSTSATEAEAATETSNGADSTQSKTSTANKELSQLGLGSFGDNGEEEVVGPRRSRRGPGASPDPKARIPKTEPDADTTSLQEPAPTDNTEAVTATNGHADADADADADAQLAEDSKTTAQASTGPEEVTDEVHTDPKAEMEDEQGLAPDAEVAEADADADAEAAEEGEIEYGDADDQADLDGDEAGDEGVTRCVCGSADENVGLMIQCETCKCWQHCVCMGMQVEEDCPDVYFCEQCRPELHIPLLRSLGLLPKSSKKGSGKGAKYSARELKEAKEAIAMLAQENARRTQAAEAAAYNSRDRKGSAHARDASKEIPKSPKRAVR